VRRARTGRRRAGRAFAQAASVTACAALLAALPATAGASSRLAAQAAQTVGTATLDAYQASSRPSTSPVSLRAKLIRDKLYVATVQGAISDYAAINYVALQAPWRVMCGTPQSASSFASAGGSGQVSNDAEFIFAQPWSTLQCPAQLPAHWTNLQLNDGTGWSHPKLLSGANVTAPTPTHTYQYAVVGHGQRVSFRLIDPSTSDNYGSFRISLRTGVTGDCSVARYQAFGLQSRSACLAAAAKGGAPRVRSIRSTVPLDQAPIGAVLRLSDVPGAANLEVPSGALTAPLLAAADTTTSAAAREEAALLRQAGLRSSAITELRLGGQSYKSTAVLFGSPTQASAVLPGAAAFAARAQAPPGTTGAVTADASFPLAQLITFTPAASGGEGGIELLTVQGPYLYTLQVLQAPDVVAQVAVEQLLHTIVARG
jgi:hypothetical protein